MARKLSEEEKRELFRMSEGAGVSGSGVETGPEGSSAMAEGAVDMLKTLPQETSLETLDDIIEYVSPEAAESYRGMVEEARERSPLATFMGGFLAPNPASKVKALSKIPLAGKAIKSMGPEAATSAAMQYGTEGEVSPGRTAIEATLGKGLTKGVSKLAIGDRLKRRAGAMGATRPSAIKRYETKSGEMFEDDYIRREIENFENMGLFDPGVKKFDADNLTFKSKAKLGEKVKGSILPPSDKEIAKRLDIMADSLGKKIDNTIQKNEYKFIAVPEDSLFNDLAAEIEDAAYQNPSTPGKVFEEVQQRLFGEEGQVLLTDINDVKKQLYKILGDRNFQKTLQDNPDKATAYRKAARFLNDIVGESVDDPKFRQYNSMYGSAIEMGKNVKGRIQKEFSDPGVSSSMAIGSPLYRVARTLEEKKEDLMGMSAQGSQMLQRNPNIQDYLRGMGAGAIPTLMKGGDQGQDTRMSRQPQSVPNLPLSLSKTKLPRDVEGVLANKEILLAKVAQQMPQYFEQVRFIVEERPEDIENMLPMILQMVPQAFESDKYNRVNNMILDPMMQEKARNDIMEDPRLPNTRKIDMIDQLNRTNILEDY
jgi:hypothetical protein